MVVEFILEKFGRVDGDNVVLDILFIIKIILLSYIDAHHKKLTVLFKNNLVIFIINIFILLTVFFEFGEHITSIIIDCIAIIVMMFIAYKLKMM